MGKLNVSMLRYLSSEEFRVLTAVSVKFSQHVIFSTHGTRVAKILSCAVCHVCNAPIFSRYAIKDHYVLHYVLF